MSWAYSLKWAHIFVLVYCLAISSVTFAPTVSLGASAAAGEAEAIFSDFAQFRNSYSLATSPENYDGESMNNYQIFQRDMLAKMVRNSDQTKKLLDKAYNYIKKYQADPRVRGTTEYGRVMALAKRMNNFRRMEERLHDDKCLSHQSATVRSLASATLFGALTSYLDPSWGCYDIELPEMFINEFADDHQVYLSCVEDGELCGRIHQREKGIYGGHPANKLRKARDILNFKQRNERMAKKMVDVAFGGKDKCDHKDHECREVLRSFPADYRHPENEHRAAEMINRGVNTFNFSSARIMNHLKMHYRDKVLLQRRSRSRSTSKLAPMESFKVKVSSPGELNRLLDSAGQEVSRDEVLEPRIDDHEVKVNNHPTLVRQAKGKLVSSPLGFATPTAMKECVADLFKGMNEGIGIKMKKDPDSTGQVALLTFPKHVLTNQITKKSIECLRDKTKEDMDTKAFKSNRDYRERLNDAFNTKKTPG